MHIDRREGSQHPVTVVVLIEAGITLTCQSQPNGFGISPVERDFSAERRG
jgi:hypothetical protein